MGTGEGSEDVGDILSAILACTPTSFPQEEGREGMSAGEKELWTQNQRLMREAQAKDDLVVKIQGRRFEAETQADKARERAEGLEHTLKVGLASTYTLYLYKHMCVVCVLPSHLSLGSNRVRTHSLAHSLAHLLADHRRSAE